MARKRLDNFIKRPKNLFSSFFGGLFFDFANVESKNNAAAAQGNTVTRLQVTR